MIRLSILILSTFALTATAGAEDLAPGLWELSLEPRVEADPGFQPVPLTLNQCVTKEDARDPGRVLKPLTAAGATDCSYSTKSYVGDNFRFTMQCPGSLDLQTSGEV